MNIGKKTNNRLAITLARKWLQNQGYMVDGRMGVDLRCSVEELLNAVEERERKLQGKSFEKNDSRWQKDWAQQMKFALNMTDALRKLGVPEETIIAIKGAANQTKVERLLAKYAQLRLPSKVTIPCEKSKSIPAKTATIKVEGGYLVELRQIPVDISTSDFLSQVQKRGYRLHSSKNLLGNTIQLKWEKL